MATRGAAPSGGPVPGPGVGGPATVGSTTAGSGPGEVRTTPADTAGQRLGGGGGVGAAGASVQRGLWDSIVSGVGSVASGVRDRVLGTLSGFARRLPGYDLLCTILGRDVVSDRPVTRNAAAIISGVLALVPGGAQMRENLQQAGAIERAGAWFDAEIPKLGLTWDTIRGLFSRAWDAVGASDLLNPAGAWQKVAGIFGPPLARLRDFALAAGRKVLEFIFEGVLSTAGGLGSQVMAIIRRAGGVVQQIFRDPVGFAGNLIAAVRGGLSAFLSNIVNHLRTGLIGWLTGSLGGLIRLPARFDLRGIVGLALDFLGITWERVKGKLARLIGARAVAMLEQGAGIVHDLYERGLGAITDRIAQFTSGIVDTVLGGIREWVQNSVVGAAITRLLSMFNPAGAVIQAILAVYNTIKFFIERAQQLGALASSIFDSISAIASGGVSGAIQFVERALGRAVPVVLGFLARLIGLGDVAGPVRNVMGRVHAVIDSAIDRVVGWIAGLARRAGGALRGRGGARRQDADPSSRGSTGAVRHQVEADLRRQLSGRPVTAESLARILRATQSRYGSRGLKSLSVRHQGGKAGVFDVMAECSPSVPAATALASLHLRVDDLEFRSGTTCVASVNGQHVGTKRATTAGHAEQRCLRQIESVWGQLAPTKSSPVRIRLQVTRSPCSECTTQIMIFRRLKEAEGYRIDMLVEIASLYEGEGSHVAGTSAEDLRELRDFHKVRIEAWDIVTALARRMGRQLQPGDLPAETLRKLEQKAAQVTEELEHLGAIRTSHGS